MQLAMVGLGKMGFNMSHRLLRGGHQVIGFAHDPKAIQALEQLNGVGAGTLQEAIDKLKAPRIVWLMIPAGNPTFETVEDLARILSPGDIVIDGGNSYYKDSIKHAEMLAAKGVEFVDCGTSGGVWGLQEGYSMMIGGKKEVAGDMSARVEPVITSK
jgi:6-phosphogluconate dehydrogenase